AGGGGAGAADKKHTDHGGRVMPTIIGIDPGKSGGIAILQGDDVTTHKIPSTPRDLWNLLCQYEPATVWIERVGPTPQMGRSSAYSFGHTVGLIGMACLAAGVRIERVSPTVWQRGVGIPTSQKKLGQGDTEKKNRNKARAQELFPGIQVIHATADALLLAEY